MKNSGLTKLMREATKRLSPLHDERGLDPLLEQISDARIVMLGEASHGTEEFYAWRRRISQRLITECGFDFIAVEGDWPDGSEINRYVQFEGGESAKQVLQGFQRWPTWMWANTEIAELTEWLRKTNHSRPANAQVGFHGLDIYSLFESIDVIGEALEKENPELAREVRKRYACFERFDRDEIAYARSTLRIPEGCANEAMQNLNILLRQRVEFDLEQNARVIQNAERYYRAMLRADLNSWNIRDTHMMDTLDLLLEKYGAGSKGIVWAHNTHIGDYRATDMADEGTINIGGLARERHGNEAVRLIGFGTYEGSVIASHAWDGPIMEMRVPPGQPESYEDVLHIACSARSLDQGMLIFEPVDGNGPFAEVRGHRAIGVVYDPNFERRGNYVPTSLSNRYDAFVFVDRTTALKPLQTSVLRHEFPETWPAGV